MMERYENRNRFPQLRRWEDRICDACIFDEYNPAEYRENPDMMKYDIMLRHGWSWEPVSHHADCRSMETFRTLADAKRALRMAVRMDYSKEPCLSCPNFRDGECHA